MREREMAHRDRAGRFGHIWDFHASQYRRRSCSDTNWSLSLGCVARLDRFDARLWTTRDVDTSTSIGTSSAFLLFAGLGLRLLLSSLNFTIQAIARMDHTA